MLRNLELSRGTIDVIDADRIHIPRAARVFCYKPRDTTPQILDDYYRFYKAYSHPMSTMTLKEEEFLVVKVDRRNGTLSKTGLYLAKIKETEEPILVGPTGEVNAYIKDKNFQLDE